jgi:putative ABC transport system permease protein
MEALWQDLRYGMRMLIKSPGFMSVAVFTLALGIGANTTVFSIVNALLLRPLPYRDPNRIVTVWEENVAMARETTEKMGWFPYRSGRFYVSGPAFLKWRSQIRAFEQVAAWDSLGRRFVLTGIGEPQEVRGVPVSAGLFPLLGVQAAMGRTFTDEEDRPGAGGVVLLGHSLWQQRYGADADIVGKEIAVSGKSLTVVGVMPRGLHLPEADLWVPLAVGRNSWDLERSSRNYMVVARLAPGATQESALAELRAYAAGIENENSSTNQGWSAAVIPLHEHLVGDVRKLVLILLGAVCFVLLIACANVANLMLVRAAGRRKELAIRAALGASRLRIIRQLLVESVLVWLLGGVIGLLLALWGMDLMAALIPRSILPQGEISLDARILGFTALASLVTAVLFGLFPALSSSKPNLNASLKEGGGTGGSNSSTRKLSGILVVTEVALALILLIGGGLLANTFLRLWNVALGFSPEKLLTMRISLPGYKYAESRRAVFFQQLLDGIGEMPGVLDAGAAYPLPFSGAQQAVGFKIEGSPADDLSANYRAVSPGYFRTMGIPLESGRWFSERDIEGAPDVMVINETMARQFWGQEDPIGKRLNILNAMGRPPREVVGVVGDVRHAGLDRESGPEMYVPYFQTPRFSTMYVVLRTHSDPLSVVAAMRGQIQALDKDQPVEEIRTMQQLLSNSVATQRFNMLLVGSFGILSLVMAAVGVYGVISYSASQRVQEIGIRLALGAQRRDILKLVVGQGMVLTVIGVAFGLAAALALTRVISSQLFGVNAADPATFALVSVILLGVALGACFIPARRATKVDPMVALRYE